MQRWHGPLPDDNPLPETNVLLSSDLEVGGFTFQRDSPHELMLYFVEITPIGEIDVYVKARGTRLKNH